MKRVLVVVEASAVTNPVSAAFRNELQQKSLGDVSEAFVLVPRFSPAPLQRVWPSARFWIKAYACLDVVLRELSDFGVLADGIVTEASPADAVGPVLPAFAPTEVVMVTRRRGRRYRRKLEHALRAPVAKMSPPSISWLST